MELPDELRKRDMSRRELLRYFGMAGSGVYLANSAAAWAGSSGPANVIARAAKTKAAGSDLGAIDHVIFLMMENRSYDHYFGAYPKGRGFDDHAKHSLGVFAQDYPGGSSLVPKNKVLPFHLNSSAGFECTDDLTHDWGPMHQCWNHGKMDSWVRTHTGAPPEYEGPHGVMTMGYYKREDLPFHWALADHFTLCDAYHCSILGPTNPNRLMAQTGTIDPTGKHGGPVTATNDTSDAMWNCTWPTMQEVLEDAGVSWKVYSPSNVGVSGKYAALKNYGTWGPGLYNPTTNAHMMGSTDNILPYFTAFRNPSSKLFQKAFLQSFPNDFVTDVMFLMYDENDGWFDHVPPPTAPHGTSGEYLTVNPISARQPKADTLGFTGPLGLGVRVPCLVISPFSRGGHIATEVFDHTSQLQLISKRFGVEVPNVSKWRRKIVGDLTSALFQSKAQKGFPKLPGTSVLLPSSGYCAANSQLFETGGAPPSLPTKQTMPNQQGGTEPASKFFKLTREELAVPDEHRTEIAIEGERPMTTKSKYNRLAAV